MSPRSITRLSLALAIAVPALMLRLSGAHPPAAIAACVFGAAVAAAAFVLMWASEAARAEVSGGLAIGLLALVAVLPEYAVDLYFAYSSGHRPEHAPFAAANMTGANRLLVGVGWPLVLLVAFRARKARAVALEARSRIDLGALLLAALIAFSIPALGTLGWPHSLALIGVYVLYLFHLARSGASEEELLGVAKEISSLPKARRRVTTIALFCLAGAIIFASAEHFADALVSLGSLLGIDRFLLVQWLAPLASETPELIAALTFAARGRAADGFAVVLSAKVNQWTLLVGSLPIANAFGGGHGAIALDSRQAEEIFLTASQTLLGVVMLADLDFRAWEAAVLGGLFLAQFVFPDQFARLVVSGLYLAIAAYLLGVRFRSIPALLRTAVRGERSQT